ncbi:MAG: NUDIX hydrolase [Pseudomonadota bacterium]
MSISSDSAPAEPLPAATTMLVREQEGRLQVYLMQRHADSDFGGSYAFPGGLVDVADDDENAESICMGLTRAEAASRLSSCPAPLAMYVAAVRECFEECGIFLGLENSGTAWQPISQSRQQSLYRYRGALVRKELSLAELCSQEDLRLDLASLSYLSFWTTPVIRKRRYATRFFLAPMPDNQVPIIDKREAVDDFWLTLDKPSIAELAAQHDLRPPTLVNLHQLAAFPSIRSLLQAARERPAHAIPEVTPVITFRDGRQDFLLHSRYPDQVRNHV